MMDNAAFSIVDTVDQERQCDTEEAFDEKRGYIRLWAHVLVRAYDDYWGASKLTNGDWGSHQRENRAVHEARRWIASDRHGVCSFLWVCEVLSLDPEAVRKRIMQGKRKVSLEDYVEETY